MHRAFAEEVAATSDDRAVRALAARSDNGVNVLAVNLQS
jgi:hypothetical protein